MKGQQLLPEPSSCSEGMENQNNASGCPLGGLLFSVIVMFDIFIRWVVETLFFPDTCVAHESESWCVWLPQRPDMRRQEVLWEGGMDRRHAVHSISYFFIIRWYASSSSDFLFLSQNSFSSFSLSILPASVVAFFSSQLPSGLRSSSPFLSSWLSSSIWSFLLVSLSLSLSMMKTMMMMMMHKRIVTVQRKGDQSFLLCINLSWILSVFLPLPVRHVVESFWWCKRRWGKERVPDSKRKEKSQRQMRVVFVCSVYAHDVTQKGKS